MPKLVRHSYNSAPPLAMLPVPHSKAIDADESLELAARSFIAYPAATRQLVYAAQRGIVLPVEATHREASDAIRRYRRDQSKGRF